MYRPDMVLMAQKKKVALLTYPTGRVWVEAYEVVVVSRVWQKNKGQDRKIFQPDPYPHIVVNQVNLRY